MVSVILPNYNHARFLQQRIDTILGQTYADFELIILDDNSIDESREVIIDYARRDNRIRYEFNEVNSGNTFRQWQKGIGLSQGEWVWIAESDDFAELTLLERLMTKLRENDRAGIAYCQSNFIDRDNNIIGNHLKNLSALNEELWKKDFCLPGKELLAKYMIIINILPNASAVVFKKSLAENVDWVEIQSYKLSGDMLFWSVLMNQTKVCFESGSLNYFRMGDFTVRSKFDTSKDYLFEILRIAVRLNEMVVISDEDKLKYIRYLKVHYNKIRKKKGSGFGYKVNWKIYRILRKFDREHALSHMVFLLRK